MSLSRGKAQYHNVEKIIVHPEFDTTNSLNDIALIILETPIQFTDIVQPIPITKDLVEAGVGCVASGWGAVQGAGVPRVDWLQAIYTSTISNDVCSKAAIRRRTPFDVTDNNVCVLIGGGHGVCHGDSGGPLAANGYLIGIVSWGMGCAAGFPDVFTRVSAYVDWIGNNTKV